jgi:hypothetical protein
MAALVATVSGCSKDPLDNMTEEESRIYITNYDSTANFGSFKTFSISDTVTVINDGQPSKQANATDLAFVNGVKSEMQAKGYVLVNRNAKPDLGINVNRIYNTSTGIIRYRDYFDYYGGYYDPYYWGYSGYGYFSPFSYATYSIREGALAIDVLNLKDAPAANKIQVVWTGLIRGSGIFNSATAPSQVRELFNQSPYLKTNQ